MRAGWVDIDPEAGGRDLSNAEADEKQSGGTAAPGPGDAQIDGPSDCSAEDAENAKVGCLDPTEGTEDETAHGVLPCIVGGMQPLSDEQNSPKHERADEAQDG